MNLPHSEAFTFLTRDHDHLRSLTTALCSAPAGPSPPAERWRSFAEQVVMEVSRHERAEEQVFWPFVRDSVTDGQRLMERGYGHGRKLRRSVAMLHRAVRRDQPLLDAAVRLQGEFEAHTAFEEGIVLPLLDRDADDEWLEILGRMLERASSRAPTRPHEYLPAVPGLLRVAAATIGRLDHLRDAVSRRGRW